MCNDKAIEVQLEDLQERAKQNQRALYGFDNEAGLIAKVDSIAKDLNKVVSNDIPHLEKDILKVIALLEEKSVTWPKLGKGLVGPVVVAVITALLVTFLHSLLF